MKYLFQLLILVAGPFCMALTVDTSFEGGSANVSLVDEKARVIEFSPAGDPVRGWPCWWYFRIDGCVPGETIGLKLRGSPKPMLQPGPGQGKPLSLDWAMADRPSISSDGATWGHGAPGKREGGIMIYQITPEKESVYVAWGPPFTPGQAVALAKRMAAASPHAEAMELCRSREGRSVPMLRIAEGVRPAAQRFGVWVEARQHAWESGGSWVAQGFGEWVLGNSAEAVWLRQHAEIFLVPIMDIDNAGTGNGGKDAIPQDHNRDWTELPHWNEVTAAQQRIGELVKQGRMDVFLDLHNPGAADKKTFFYTLPPDQLKEPALGLQNQFMALAKQNISPVMPMLEQPKFSGPGYHPLWRQISNTWVTLHGNPHTMALCLETSWNTERSTQTGYQSVGAALGKSVQQFLATRPVRGE